ncbi:hypothetical protein QTH25_13205 [Clostridium perfringens]|uniref:hypothetical protein n=1 Tax=Clostridium perfringens TaxID=1502 RepID=UPI0033903C5D|nr:hypothetical protein [Clostridium perfringens]
MERSFWEKRAWQRWLEVKKLYYDDYAPVEECLEKVYEVLGFIEENDIELTDAHNFSINVELAQFLIEGKFIIEAKEHLKIAKQHIVTEYNRSYLDWKMAELYIEVGNKEEALRLYMSSLEYYKNIKEYKNELAIKHQIAKYFKIYKYVKEIILKYIDLYKQGIECANPVRDTYMTFKELATENNDYMFLHKVNKELNELKIAL